MREGIFSHIWTDMPYKDPEAAREAARRRYAARDKDAYRAKKAAYKAANPELVRASKERYRETHRTAIRARRYGISAHELTALHKAADGRCAICTQQPSQRELHIDHCHVTGKVRGLLCHHCNTALGLFKDNTVLLQAAANYLEKSCSS